MAEVRRATRADRSALAPMLARAFHDDPVISWVTPDDRARPARASKMFGLHLDRLLPFGEVYVDEQMRAAALWAPPGEWRWPPFAGMRLLLTAGLRAIPRITAGFTTIERAHPKKPHYYLAVLGTDPSAQGQGLGSAVLAPILQMCDADGVGAYLESSKEKNIAFYSRHGFKVTRWIDMPGGPRVFLMWREPRGSGPPSGV
ncbi:MAG: hypothetical protein QOG62_1027 [Thermoleophilaceae bacterium]|jgi:ribosomal protein S18 acetylase RimI-like enzyme|nr:hypothetical protein [Thermoleophilaceae bacterium]